jgi:hypothetical protein
MISTVTTSTISTVTTAALAGSLALIGVLVFGVMLIQKELTTASDDRRMRKLSQALTIGIIPLLITFLLIAGYKIMDVIR